MLAHKVITTWKNELGTLSFLFWVETFVGILLLPWAILNGEASVLIASRSRPLSDWFLVLATAAYGGIRIYSQFYFLQHTSATTLALSNLAVQGLTIILGIVVFSEPTTLLLALGVLLTGSRSASPPIPTPIESSSTRPTIPIRKPSPIPISIPSHPAPSHPILIPSRSPSQSPPDSHRITS